MYYEALMSKVVKEGDHVSGGYVFTELGAKTLNNCRSREEAGVRATALEKMAFSYRKTDPKIAASLLEMNAGDGVNIFLNKRKTLLYEEIEALINRLKGELIIES